MKSQCPSCRSFNNADAVFCDQCGSRINAGGRLPAPRRAERARPRGSVRRVLAWTLGGGATLAVIAFLARTEFFGPEKNSRPGQPGLTPEVLVRIDEVDAADATQTVRQPAARPPPVTDALPFHKLKPLVHRGIVQLVYLDEDGDKLESTALGVLLAPSGDVLTRLQPMLGARSGVCVVYGRRRAFRIGGAAEIDVDRDLALLTLLDSETGEPVEVELPLLDPLVGEEARALHPGQETYAFGKPMGWDKDWVLTEVAEYPYYGSSRVPRLLLADGDDDLKEGAFVAVDPRGVVIGLCSRDEGRPDEPASLVVDPVVALEYALGRPATLSLSQISMRYFDGTFADFARRGRKAFARDRYADACERFFQALDQANGPELVKEADLEEVRSFLQKALDGFRTRARDRKGWGELVGILEKAVEYLAGYRELWLDLANAHMSTANYPRAVEAGIETLKLGFGEDVTGLLQMAYLKLADQLAEQGDSNSAAHAILEGINYMPGSARLHMSLAKIYMSWRFYEDASRVFQIAARLDLAYSDEVQLYLQRIEDALSRREAVVIPFSPEDRSIQAVVVLDGFAEYDFIVDTGASKTAITQRMAAELGYGPDDYIGMATVLTAKGRDTVGVLRLGAVSLQGYTVRNVDVFVLNNALGTGLLGLNFLSHFKVTMDSSRGEFRLESQ